MHIAIQGGRDSFHELAAKKYYRAPRTFVYCDSFDAVFAALADGTADRAFVAIRNSSHGAIEPVNILLEAYGFRVEGHHGYAIRQHLIGIPGSSAATVSMVMSHPVALSQCRRNLRRFAGTAEWHDTAAAVEHVRSLNDTAIAALGSREAAERYGMKVILENVNDDQDNYTVFASLRIHDDVVAHRHAEGLASRLRAM